MKRKCIFIMVLGAMFSLLACHDEDSLSPEYEYGGPIPAIVDGPSEAQKICYELYKTYDLHVYYTLAGDDALQTIVGPAQNPLWGDEIEAGDEMTSTAFLKLMKKFYDALPENLVKSSVRRHVLLKGCSSMDIVQYYYEDYPMYIEGINGGMYSFGMASESYKGIVYWGNMDDDIGVQTDFWKYSLCYTYFDSRLSNASHPELPLVKDLIAVSAGKYITTLLFYEDMDALYEAIDEDAGMLNMDYLLTNGFVNADSWCSVRNDYGVEEGLEYLDLVAYATWIACTPLAERQEILDNYPLVKQKYDISIAYLKKYLDFDIEAFSEKWVNVDVE